MRPKRTLTALLGAALLVAGLPVVTAAPAQAASCSRGTCTGKDPKATGCSSSGVTTLDEFTDGGFRVELRYSRTCHAAWTRWTVASQLNISRDVYIRRYDANFRQTGSYHTISGTSPGQSGWTRMIGKGTYPPLTYFRSCQANATNICTQYVGPTD